MISFDFCVYLTNVNAVLKAVLLLLTLWFLRSVKRRPPPAPFQLPVVGCLPFLDKLPHLTLSKWAEKLGPVFQCRFGGKNLVVLNDAKIVREAFFRDEFSERPSMFTTEMTNGHNGLMFSPSWALHRKFIAKTFRKLGVGKDSIESRISEEASRLVQIIDNYEGKHFSNKSVLQATVGNVICSVLFGQQFDPADPKTFDFYRNMNIVSSYFGVTGALNIFPILRFIPSVKQGFQKVMLSLSYGAEFIQDIIGTHKENPSATGAVDYMDAAIKAQQDEINENGFSENFSDPQLIGIARELFITGYETITTSLRWAFLYSINYREIQQKIHDELDTVIGFGKSVTYDDLKDLPYTQAFLNECARISTVTPLAVPHKVSEEVELGGFTMPKDSWVVANMWHIHHDRNVWGDPETFRPERFLSADGKFSTVKELMPFSVGKRSCPGEQLARMEVFLLFTRVLQRFSIEGDGPCEMTAVNGVALDTKDYKMICRPRINV